MRADNLIFSIDNKVYLYKLSKDIYKLDIPPVTSLFFVKNNKKWCIIDTGINIESFEKIISLAAKKIDMNFNNVTAICITHNHWDHIQGLPIFLKNCKNAVVYSYEPPNIKIENGKYKTVNENTLIESFLKAITVFGHSADSVAYMDLRTNTLFCGDALQLYGVSTAGMYIFDGVKTYINSLEKIKQIEINNILAAHPYVPLGAFAIGATQVKEYIEKSELCIKELVNFTLKEHSLGISTAEDIKYSFIKRNKKIYTNFPTDGFVWAVRSIIAEF